MKKSLILLFLLLFSGSIMAQQGSVGRPRLVVGIVIDQMRWDYIYRYYNRYGDGGFKRLLREGASCENTMALVPASASATTLMFCLHQFTSLSGDVLNCSA